MSDLVTCFLVERTDYFVRALRRYSQVACAGRYGYHTASLKIGLLMLPNVGEAEEHDVSIAHDDPRWPRHCDHCAYEFVADDNWQVNDHRLYRQPGNDRLFSLENAPAGAMWDAYWMGNDWVGPDGKHLTVKLPDGTDWLIDGPDKDGNCAWKRNGSPPLVSVRPSIMTLGYHGWLTEGCLKAC